MSHFIPQPHLGRKIHAPIRAKFGRWTVLCDDEGKRWICMCDCGTIRSVDAHTVRSGKSISCGCYKNEQAGKRNAKDISGQRFGRLIAVRPTERRGADSSVFWVCQCDCGNSCEVATTYLNNGTRSCGCLHGGVNSIDLTGQRFGRLVAIEPINIKHGRAWRCRCDCGKETVVLTASLRKGLTRSCKCLQAETRIVTSTGKNHWNWKGGVVPWNQRYRAIPEYREWREAVLERDNHSCQLCGDASSTLAAHHLESYASAPILRLDVGNGITLCKACHWDFHAKYGKRNNTKQQFVEYATAIFRGHP